MLLLGKQITVPTDKLNPVEVEKIYKAILNQEGEVAIFQKKLQAIRLIDMQQYRKLKTKLPYLVCAHFQPRVRKKENFVFTERFIIDIDHLLEFDIDLAALKEKLKHDSRVELMFTSPGGDGLKVFFVLQEKISDSGYYALFYKSFCLQFSRQYQLNGAVDSKTNDVSRCCFVSHDPEAFYNPSAEKINAAQYLPEEGAAALDFLKAEIRETEKLQEREKKEIGIEKTAATALSEDILSQIKVKIGMKVKKTVEKKFIQPQELDEIVIKVVKQLDEIGASILHMQPIDYGRQIRIGAGKYWAEVNLFYGKRGVSIVGTTKTGSNKELCDNIVLLLKDHFIDTAII